MRRRRTKATAAAWLLAATTTLTTVAVTAPIDVPVVAAAVPNGFGDGVVASGLTLPTGVTWLPDGRMLITEKNGVVRLAQNGAVSPTPFLDLSGRVSDHWDRGLLGMAVDPDFTTGRPYVYFLYPYDPSGSDDPGIKSLRLSRFTVTGNTASLASEVVVLGSLPSPGCQATPGSADCLPNDWYGHGPGSLVFAPDETLYVAMGDGASWDYVDSRALRAQDIDQYPGKILRIDRDGNGLASNPFFNGDPRSVRSRVWAYGFRNPFRFALRSGGNVLHVGDVGWLTREEFNIVSAGDNAGWPCYEGPNQQPGYASFSQCQALYARGSGAVRRAAVDWSSIGGAAAIGGPSASVTNFPSPWNQGIFYGDYANGWIRYLPLNGAGSVSGSPVDFATGIDSPVDIKVGPDGSLYYVSIMAGQVRRIAVGNDPPTPPPFGVSYLSDLTPFGTPTNGFGPYERDRSNGSTANGDGVPIRIGGAPFAKGLGVHAASEVRYVLDKPCRLQATIGVDDEVGNAGSVVFEVWNGVSTRLYQSGVRTGADAGVSIDVNLAGVSQVRLVVTDAGNGNAEDHASWGNARFVCGTQGAPVPTITSPGDVRFAVGDTVTFGGAAVDPEDGPVPASRLSWVVTIHHCPQGNCHSHFLTTASGASGSFVLPDHGDDTYLTLDLTATDSAGLATTVSQRVEYRTSHVTLDTMPSGRTIVYDGNAVQTPYVADVPVGAVRTLSVAPSQGGATFLGWSDEGAITHDVTIPDADVAYVASFDDAVMVPVTPARLMDTREGLGGDVVVGNTSRRLPVLGRGGVPTSGVSAVVLNVTVTDPIGGDGFVTVWPEGTRPVASSLNYRSGQTVPNLVTVGLGADGAVELYSLRTAHLVVDVVGWYADGFVPVQPSRLADTREGLNGIILLAGETRRIQVADRGGVPANGAIAVALNVTATRTFGAGYFTVWPGGSPRPTASNLNFTTNETVANAVIVGIGPDGSVNLFNSSPAAEMIVDVTGWFASGFTPVTPSRVMDTREGLGGIVLGPQETRRLQVVGVAGVPAFGVDAVAANVTVTEPTGAGFVTAWPSGRSRPLASNLNFLPGQTVANAAVIGVGPGGTIELYNSSGSSQIVVDITGWFSSTPSGPTFG